MTVIQPVALQAAPVDQTILLGGTAHFRVIAAGSAPLKFNWSRDGVPLSDGSLIASGSVRIVSTATASDLYVTSGTAGTANYNITVTGPQPDARAATAGVPSILVDGSLALNAGNPKPVGSTVVLTAGTSAATGANPTYAWYKVGKDTTALTTVGTWAIDGGSLTYNVATTTASFYAKVTGGGTVQTTDPVTILINSKAFSLTTGSVAASGPEIISQPLSQSVGPAEDAVLSVGVSGGAGYSYQWYKVGNPTTAVSGGTGSSITLPGSDANRAGLYYVTVTDSASASVNSQAALVFVNAADPLGMSAQGVLANEGEDIMLRTFGIGDGLTYQWSKQISGGSWTNLSLSANSTAQSANLVLGTLRGGSLTTVVSGSVASRVYVAGDDGSYKVSVSVDGQKLTDLEYTVVVIRKALITAQPESQRRMPGERATLSAGYEVQQIGTEKPGYSAYQWMLAPRFQWYFRRALTDDWAPVPGAIAATYEVASVASADAGYYKLEITNNAGTTVSESAQVSVFQPVTVSIEPVSSVDPGSTLRLRAVVTGDLADAEPFQWYKQTGSTYTAIGSLNSAAYRASGYNSGTLTISGVNKTDAVNFKVRALGKVVVKAPDVRYVDSAPVKVNLNTRVAFGSGVSGSATTSLVSGESVTLKVNVTGSNVEARWYKLSSGTWSSKTGWNSVNGEAFAAYSIPSVVPADAGTYGV
ncbi:MAG: hypothetical protein EBV25_04045, partial [Methylophilaceae bacterium]|nr:hypothetical protein [Methylophilaceae bacterium]